MHGSRLVTTFLGFGLFLLLVLPPCISGYQQQHRHHRSHHPSSLRYEYYQELEPLHQEPDGGGGSSSNPPTTSAAGSYILTENFNTLQYHRVPSTAAATTPVPPPVTQFHYDLAVTTTTPPLALARTNPKLDYEHGDHDDRRPPSPTTPSNKCEFWLVSNEGNLTSFGDYSHSVNCVYRVTPLDPSVCSLELDFHDFDVADLRSESQIDPKNQQVIEKEFSQLSSDPDSCIDNYLEFNNRKRYCHSHWKNRMDVVEIDPNYEKDFLFRLVLDRKTHSSGFHISYKPVFDSCKPLEKKYDKLAEIGSTLYPVQMPAMGSSLSYCEKRFTAMEFEIKSTNYPKNYSNNLDCIYYIIRNSDDVCGLELKFVHFDIEASEGCAYDFFEIDGENFCGRLPNGSRNIFKFDTNVKSISFQTDSQVTAPGFHIKVRQVKDCANAFMPVENVMMGHQARTQKCSIVWHERKGQLSSLKYPENYPNDLLCAYTIERNPDGQFCGIQINFIDFNVQDSKSCSADFFEIENKRYCGRTLHQMQKNIPFNQDGYVRFLFKSDSVESRPGFLLNYTQTPCKDSGNEQSVQALHSSETKSVDVAQEKHQTPNCVREFNQKRFILASDSVDGHYKRDQNCQYTIRKYSNKVCYLEMHFKIFDLEASADCQYDYMDIGSAVRLCGTLNQETSRIYVFDKPEMLVTFHTDGTNQRRGFLIDTEQLECEGDRIVREHDLGPEDPKEGLQSSEQYKFEQQRQYINDSGLKQQENQIHQQSSELSIFNPKIKYGGPSSVYCSKTYQQKEFFIHSPGFPSNYKPDLDCLYMIIPSSPDVCKIEINFDSFELQPYDYEKNCLKSDFLDIDNKEQFCGKMAESQSKIYPVMSNETFFIHFHSDSFRTSFDKGFRLYVRQIECQYPPHAPQTHCSRIFTSSSFEIQSPMFPAPYPPNSYCDYRIIKLKGPGLNVCFLEVHFFEFDLQNSPNCNKDYVSFNGIKLCGPIVKDSLRLFPFYDNEFTISFYSDPSINHRGFYLKINQNECPPTPISDAGTVKRPPLPLPQQSSSQETFPSYQILQANQLCQQTFNSIIFDFQSPNYPHYYLPSLSCAFTIQRRHNRYCKLELFLVDFDVEPSLGCLEDYLLIDNVKYCNSNRPTSVLQLPFYEPEKRIYFRSASFRRRKGFMIQARQIDCDTMIMEPKYLIPEVKSPPPSSDGRFVFLPSLPSICEICVTEVTGQIQSYDYPNFYPPNLNCTYRITPLPDNCMAQLKFSEFDFDYSQECNQDFLEINGIRYCGNQLKGVSMILLNKRKDDLLIRMVTSSRGAVVKPSFRGFRASYVQLPCLDTAKSSHQATQVPQILPSKSMQTAMRPENPDQKLNQMPATVPIPDQTTPRPAGSESIYCDQTFDDQTFEIKSPGYPYRYFDELECSYLIRKYSANVCRLKVTFNHFHVVGEDANCRGDYLDLFSTRFCGVLDRYTAKEIPFLQEKLLLRFHTNHHQTADGFHLTVEQIDCVSGQPINKRPQDIQEPNLSKTNVQKQKSSKSRPSVPQTPADKFNQKGDPGLKYDDDEIMSEFDTRKATVEPKNTGDRSQVIYEDRLRQEGRKGYSQKQMNHNNPNQGNQRTGQDANSGAYPLRYISHNITVMDEGEQDKEFAQRPVMIKSMVMRPEQHPDEEQTKYFSNHNDPNNIQNSYHDERPSKKLCDESFVEKVYFELRVSDLKMTKKGANCQLHIKKAKPNICQLDIMFIRYNISDTSCSQQYLSVDGERICGHVHESTIKKFWFVQPEMFLFIKLNQMEPLSDDTFEIKARQVECAANVDVQQLSQHVPSGEMPPSQSSTPIGSDHHRDRNRPDSGRYPQQRFDTEDDPTTIVDKDNDHRYMVKGVRQPIRNKLDPDRIPQQMLDPGDGSVSMDMNGGHRYTKPNWKSYGMRQPFRTENASPKDMKDDDDVDDPYKSQEQFHRHCDLIENEIHFKINSPRDRTATRCRYTIRKASDKVCAIDIRFDTFQLQEAIKCDKEYLEIDSSRICGAFPAGHQRRYHFLPDEYEKAIYFIGSKSLNDPGEFKLDVRQIEDCDKPTAQKTAQPMPTVCDMAVRNVRGNIRSPNYPSPYGDFTKCVYRIQAIGNDFCSVKLKIRDLDIEPGSRGTKNCDKDSLQFGPTRLCGNKPSQSEYTIPFEFKNGHKMAQIKFTTDSFGTGRGFDIEYKQELCVSDRLKQNFFNSGQKGLSVENRFRVKSPSRIADPSATSPSSRGSTPSMRPHYPPNYVSKAHMLKTMDRKEFIKMMLMEEQEKEKIKMDIRNGDRNTMSTTMSTTPSPTEFVPSSRSSSHSTQTTIVPENTIVFTTMPSITEDVTDGDSNVITTETPSATATNTLILE